MTWLRSLWVALGFGKLFSDAWFRDLQRREWRQGIDQPSWNWSEIKRAAKR